MRTSAIRNFVSGVAAAPVTLTFITIAIGGIYSAIKLNQPRRPDETHATPDRSINRQITEQYYPPIIIPDRTSENLEPDLQLDENLPETVSEEKSPELP